MKKSAELITIAIVEDVRGTRENLLELLKRRPGLKCVGAFATGEEAVKFMVDEGFQEPAQAEKKLLRAQLDSTQLAQYFLGLDEIRAFEKDYRAKVGASSNTTWPRSRSMSNVREGSSRRHSSTREAARISTMVIGAGGGGGGWLNSKR